MRFVVVILLLLFLVQPKNDLVHGFVVPSHNHRLRPLGRPCHPRHKIHPLTIARSIPPSMPTRSTSIIILMDQLHPQREKEEGTEEQDEAMAHASSSTTSSSVWDWNYAAGSIGSMLLRMQKEEQELRRTNLPINGSMDHDDLNTHHQWAMIQSQAVEIDPTGVTHHHPHIATTTSVVGSTADTSAAAVASGVVTMDHHHPSTSGVEFKTPPLTTSTTTTASSSSTSKNVRRPPSTTSILDLESVKELDDAVTVLTGSMASLTQGIQIRPLPYEYLSWMVTTPNEEPIGSSSSRQPTTTTTTTTIKTTSTSLLDTTTTVRSDNDDDDTNSSTTITTTSSSSSKEPPQQRHGRFFPLGSWYRRWTSSFFARSETTTSTYDSTATMTKMVKTRTATTPSTTSTTPVTSTASSSSSRMTTTTTTVLPLSLPEHYHDRINRDMRHLAVSIALSVEDVGQWRLFCQEKGGIIPLLECIREGARALQKQEEHFKPPSSIPSAATPSSSSSSSSDSSSSSSWHRDEESFLAACSACRAIRDLCAISPEVAVVITDCILRANAAWKDDNDKKHNYQDDEKYDPNQNKNGVTACGHSLMSDFVTLLQHGQDMDDDNGGVGEDESSHNNNNNMMNRKRWWYRPIEVLRQRRRRQRQRRNNPDNWSRGFGIRRQNHHKSMFPLQARRHKKEARLRCKLYVTQLLLAMAVSSDNAVETIRSTVGLKEAVLDCSSYCRSEQTQRWLRYPGKMILWCWRRIRKDHDGGGVASAAQRAARRRPFIEAAAVGDDLAGQVQGTANQVLAAIGYNQWVPKIPGQKGLRLLVLDGGGSRGLASLNIVHAMVEELGTEVADSFDMIAGTSTGGIIAFLIGLLREPSKKALVRYNQLIKQIFVKSALSAPLMLLTTATYDEAPFMSIMTEILGENIMLDSRADPAVPLVFCVTSKMSSTPTHIALFRNYNYGGGELRDPFVVDPMYAREELGLPLELEHELVRKHSPGRRRSTSTQDNERLKPQQGGGGAGKVKTSTESSRHPGSFRVLQRYALRATTAAPTVFKPVLMGGEMYCDGGIVASNPAAVAIHEARTLFPDVPIELVVSVGTGTFTEQKSAPRIGWDGIIGQIVNSACDGEQIHHILEDVLGEGKGFGKTSMSKTRYYRLNPPIGMPDAFPIDVTDPEKLARLSHIAREYVREPEQQQKIKEICDILEGGRRWRNIWPWQKDTFHNSYDNNKKRNNNTRSK